MAAQTISSFQDTTMDRARAAEQDRVLPVRAVREKPFITMSHYKDFLNAQSQGLPWKPTSISESLAVLRVGQSVTVKEKAKITVSGKLKEVLYGSAAIGLSVADVQDISEESSNCENSSQDSKDASSKEDLPEQYMSDVDLPQDDNRNQAKGKGVASKKRCLSQNNAETDNENPGRQIVDDDHVGKLVRDYRKYLAEFSKGRKKKIKQLIPNKVWIKVYVDYKKVFLASPFMLDSLKDHLRTALKEMPSGVNQPEAGDGTEPQDKEILKQLMQTKGWKMRNVLRTRNGAFQGASNSGNQAIASGAGSGGRGPSQAAIASFVHDQSQSKLNGAKPVTKSQHLKLASENISEMPSEFKRKYEEAKIEAANAKRAESEARKIVLQKQNAMADIKLLKEQYALGLMGEDEFKEKCRVAFAQ